MNQLGFGYTPEIGGWQTRFDSRQLDEKYSLRKNKEEHIL